MVAEPEPEDDGEILEPAAAVEEAAPIVKELIGTSVASDSDDDVRDLIVDLGEFDHSPRPEPEPAKLEPVEPIQPDDSERDQVLVGSASEKSGLFGAVRAAFVRSRTPHEHDFVQAPGGIGIVRNICSECGHISIGVTD